MIKITIEIRVHDATALDQVMRLFQSLREVISVTYADLFKITVSEDK